MGRPKSIQTNGVQEILRKRGVFVVYFLKTNGILVGCIVGKRLGHGQYLTPQNNHPYGLCLAASGAQQLRGYNPPACHTPGRGPSHQLPIRSCFFYATTPLGPISFFTFFRGHSFSFYPCHLFKAFYLLLPSLGFLLLTLMPRNSQFFVRPHLLFLAFYLCFPSL